MNQETNTNAMPSNHLPLPFNGRGQGGGSVVLVFFGMLLITAAFVVPPTGIIDPTVLTAFGEMLTFAGSLIGIDYHYKYKNQLYSNDKQDTSEGVAQ